MLTSKSLMDEATRVLFKNTVFELEPAQPGRLIPDFPQPRSYQTRALFRSILTLVTRPISNLFFNREITATMRFGELNEEALLSFVSRVGNDMRIQNLQLEWNCLLTSHLTSDTPIYDLAALRRWYGMFPRVTTDASIRYIARLAVVNRRNVYSERDIEGAKLRLWDADQRCARMLVVSRSSSSSSGEEVTCSRSEEEYEGNYGVSKCSRAFEAVSGDTRPTTRLAAAPSRR